MYTRTNMAGKLYWRVKKNGKWTWTPAHVFELKEQTDLLAVLKMEEE